MKKNWIILGLFLMGGLIMFSTGVYAESITLSTYYPAPFGAYDRLKLVPRDSLPLDPNCNDKHDLGVMYYDRGNAEMVEGLYVCQAIHNYEDVDEIKYNWVMMGQLVVDSEDSPQKAKVICAKENGKIGVCINNPSFDGTCGCK